MRGEGVPLTKITLTGLILVALFLIAGVVLDVTNHTDQGAQAMATATGIAIGTGATTVVVQQAANNAADEKDDSETPKAA